MEIWKPFRFLNLEILIWIWVHKLSSSCYHIYNQSKKCPTRHSKKDRLHCSLHCIAYVSCMVFNQYVQ